ncbi:hypothetical protein L8106_00980 [Lyngbya sp. PCC 8106]|nr:hypothetical protein L8106_00980 [Lyngbya sp. PCC 8106]
MFQSLIGIIGDFEYLELHGEKPSPEVYRELFQSLIGIIGDFEQAWLK